MKPCDKPQTGGASVAFIAVALSFLYRMKSDHTVGLKPQCGLPLMSDPAKHWHKPVLYGLILTGNKRTTGSCGWVDFLKFHLSCRLTHATSGPGKQTGRSNRRANQCPPQRWRPEQRDCVDIQLQNTARPV